MDSALTRLEQFALRSRHKTTANYFNNESIKKPKTVWIFKDSDNIVMYLGRFITSRTKSMNCLTF